MRDTIIVAHGGATLGYALHLKDGRVVFSVRTGAKNAVTDVRSEPINGPVKVTAALARTERSRSPSASRPPSPGRPRVVAVPPEQLGYRVRHQPVSLPAVPPHLAA
jgi:hypothetical protein